MHVPPRVIRPQHTTRWLTAAELPTRFGTFTVHAFESVRVTPQSASSDESTSLPREDLALVYGDISGRQDVVIRIHSECMTSEVFGSLKCDCKEQLDHAMETIAQIGSGAILYLRQEGRGIGLVNKLKAYRLQAEGHDTVDANRLLGLPDDAREYSAVCAMLEHFHVKSVRVLTNNPAKLEGLRALGITVTGRLPIVIAPNRHSHSYLETKRDRMAHELPEHLGDSSIASGAAE